MDPEGVAEDDGFGVLAVDPINSRRHVVSLVVVRVCWLAAAVALIHVGLGTWPGFTVAGLLLAAAWLLGRVD